MNTEAALYDPAAQEELLYGSRLLRHAFLGQPLRSAARNFELVRAGEKAAPVLMIERGIAYRTCILLDGKRAILDLLLPRDFAGLERAIMRHPVRSIIAAEAVSYRALSREQVRELMQTRSVSLTILARMAEEQARVYRHVAMLSRLDAFSRLCVMLLDMHDRLRRREMIARSTFVLPLTQEQMAEYLGLTLVHVNRILKSMREKGLALVDRQVVTLKDVDQLREIADGLPGLTDVPEARTSDRAAAEATFRNC